MNWNDLFAAFALYLVIEGLFPFAVPGAWRRSITMLGSMSESQLRIFGGCSVAAGLMLLYAVRA